MRLKITFNDLGPEDLSDLQRTDLAKTSLPVVGVPADLPKTCSVDEQLVHRGHWGLLMEASFEAVVTSSSGPVVFLSSTDSSKKVFSLISG